MVVDDEDARHGSMLSRLPCEHHRIALLLRRCRYEGRDRRRLGSLQEGIAQLLKGPGLSRRPVRHRGRSLLKVRSYTPDVAIVDIRMPPTTTDEGLKAAREIRQRHPDVGVLVLSQYVEGPYMMELLQGDIEGVGYLSRTASATSTSSPTRSGGRGPRFGVRPRGRVHASSAAARARIRSTPSLHASKKCSS